jgi:hypothetical protein
MSEYRQIGNPRQRILIIAKFIIMT